MPRFVLLEHRRDGIHWDFLLETDEGPLRAWAIDREVQPGRDLSARALPDHRAIYLDYEGEISGDRGRVQRIDGGTYEPTTWTEDLIRVRLEGNQLRGPVELRRAVSGVGSASGGRDDWLVRFGKLD